MINITNIPLKMAVERVALGKAQAGTAVPNMYFHQF